MIKLDHVSKFYASGDSNVSLGLHNVSLEMNMGEIIGVVGESGSGKSTFLNVVSMLDTFEDGEIYYNDIPASTFTPEEIGEFRKNNIGFVFQNYNLIDSYTVLENVIMPLIIKGYTHKEAKEKAKEIIKKVGLEKRMHHKGTKLSGGEKQRCVIARALASDSKILACDEPTGNLDSKTGREIIELIKEVANDKLVIIVTHNYDELKDIITRRLTFADGKLIEDMKIKDANIISDEALDKTTEKTKISFKEKMRLSLYDVLSTPKKTILTLLIFFAISAFIAYLYSGLLTYKKSYSDPGIFNNTAKDRYIIYDDGKELNYSDFEDLDYFKYGIVEDQQFYIQSNEGRDKIAMFRSTMPSIKLSKGRLPENSNEVVVGVPEKQLQTFYENTITIGGLATRVKELNDFYVDDKELEYQVVGYYIIDDTTFNNYIVSGTEDFNKRMTNTVLRMMAYYNLTVDFANSYTRFSLDNDVLDNVIQFTIPRELEGVLNDPKKHITINYNGQDLDLTNYTIDIIYGNELQVKASANTFFNIGESNSKYISVYETDQVKVDNLISKAKNLGYGVCNAKEAYIHEDISFAAILNTILFAFYLVGVIFAFVVVFLISYFILARIYSIKNKDYTVFRTLGMSKKDMASLVRIETVVSSMFTSILVLIIVLISYMFRRPLISGFHRIGVIGIIVYLLFMFGYSLLFAIRFNRKLYKFSVQKTFRGGVLGND